MIDEREDQADTLLDKGNKRGSYNEPIYFNDDDLKDVKLKRGSDNDNGDYDTKGSPDYTSRTHPEMSQRRQRGFLDDYYATNDDSLLQIE